MCAYGSAHFGNSISTYSRFSALPNILVNFRPAFIVAYLPYGLTVSAALSIMSAMALPKHSSTLDVERRVESNDEPRDPGFWSDCRFSLVGSC